MPWTWSTDCAFYGILGHTAWTWSTTRNCTSSKNALDLVQGVLPNVSEWHYALCQVRFIAPVICPYGAGVEFRYHNRHSDILEADFHEGILKAFRWPF